jgi:hypothetical protein
MLGEHWVEGKFPHLPHCDLVARELFYIAVVADRE